VSWALAQLGGALTLVCPAPLLEKELKRFAAAYQEGLRHAMFDRLNLVLGDFDKDLTFLQGVFDWLTQTQAGWDQFFHDWYCGAASADRAAQGPQATLYADAAFAPVREGLEARTGSGTAEFLTHAYWRRPTPHTMLIDDVESLWTPIAERDDWSLFEDKLRQIDEMRAALNGGAVI
jgi:uncharacterized protein YdiU (UPF0061 family)